jgi:hypothetical protein
MDCVTDDMRIKRVSMGMTSDRRERKKKICCADPTCWNKKTMMMMMMINVNDKTGETLETCLSNSKTVLLDKTVYFHKLTK